MSVSPERQRQVAEQIAETKRIYLAIRNALPRHEHAAVMLTSAIPGEGKSLIASGMAASASQNVGRVLVMDMNWHHPSLHQWFDMEPWFELEELQGTQNIISLARTTSVESLDILAAPKAIQTLTRLNGNFFELASTIISQCKKEYDLVVVDGAPVFPTNRCMMDPVALSGLCDGVAMVVMANRTPRQDVKRAQKILETGGARILGIIMNQRRSGRH